MTNVVPTVNIPNDKFNIIISCDTLGTYYTKASSTPDPQPEQVYTIPRFCRSCNRAFRRSANFEQHFCWPGK